MFGRKRKQRDQKTLIKEMTRLVGAQHVLYEDADLIGYEYDATIERARPEVVVLPANKEQVAEVVAICREYDRPIVPRGSGSGLSGGAVPVKGGVVIVLTRLNEIVKIDTAIIILSLLNLQLQQKVDC